MGEATITGGQPVVGHSANFMSKDALPKHDGYGGDGLFGLGCVEKKFHPQFKCRSLQYF